MINKKGKKKLMGLTEKKTYDFQNRYSFSISKPSQF